MEKRKSCGGARSTLPVLGNPQLLTAKSHPKAHNLQHSMSRRRNCHDNAVADTMKACKT